MAKSPDVTWQYKKGFAVFSAGAFLVALAVEGIQNDSRTHQPSDDQVTSVPADTDYPMNCPQIGSSDEYLCPGPDAIIVTATDNLSAENGYVSVSHEPDYTQHLDKAVRRPMNTTVKVCNGYSVGIAKEVGQPAVVTIFPS